jgi:uncharacterized membrane protein
MVADPSSAAAARPGNRSAATAAGVLGFALGGVSDGIMPHQVLQWHHFLSPVPGRGAERHPRADPSRRLVPPGKG